MGMALVDLVPVLIFAYAVSEIAKHVANALFAIGACLCVFAGLGKVAWKIVLAISKKDVRFLFLQMRVLMPLGFLSMIIGTVMASSRLNWDGFIHNCLLFPSNFSLIIGIIGIILMGVWAKKLDPDDAKSNWIEQCTNIVAQLGFAIGIVAALV